MARACYVWFCELVWNWVCHVMYKQQRFVMIFRRILQVVIFYPCHRYPRYKVHGANRGAHLGPVGPKWAPCWPHEPCYQGNFDTHAYMRVRSRYQGQGQVITSHSICGIKWCVLPFIFASDTHVHILPLWKRQSPSCTYRGWAMLICIRNLRYN